MVSGIGRCRKTWDEWVHHYMNLVQGWAEGAGMGRGCRDGQRVQGAEGGQRVQGWAEGAGMGRGCRDGQRVQGWAEGFECFKTRTRNVIS